MTRIQKISLLLFLSFISVCTGQTELPKNELDNKYTPNASSMFNNLVKKSYDQNSYTEVEFKNAVKYFPIALARQKVFFTYERALYKGLVVSGGLGKAFGRDVFQNAFLTSSLSGFNEITYMSPDDALTNATYLNSRPFIQLGGKIYFSGNAYEEMFMEINYRRERINYLLSPMIGSNRIEGENDLAFKMNAFSLGFGYTGVSGEKNNIVHEIYFNFGFKTFKFTQYDLVGIQNPVTLKNELIYRKVADSFISARIVPTINIGYCFGFGW